MLNKRLFIAGSKFLLFPFFIVLVFVSIGFTSTKNPGKELTNDFNSLLIPESPKFISILADSIGLDSAFNQDSLSVDSTLSLADSNFTNIDSLLTRADSISQGLIDTVKVDSMAIDSTARLKYFKFQREDNQSVSFRSKKKSSFFAYPSTKYFKRVVELDSTGQFVLIKETIAGQATKTYLKIPVEDYIDMKLNSISKDLWEEQGYAYQLKDDKKDLSGLISDITNIEIPLPSNSFLSIFGPPVINLRISGAVDIHGAWRNETTEGLTASRLGNTRNEPDFKQQVQINVNGTIGDKLTIAADWNTERTFEYENQLSIKYTGYEDEIIQSIEAGNVSLQTSPLVGGSEALFGIKARFQMGPFSLTALASQKKGEVEEVSLTGGSETQTFEKHAYDYSDNHYFVDTVYAETGEGFNIFNKIYGNPNPVVDEIVAYNQIKEIEVWKTTFGIIDPTKERKANAFIKLEPRPITGYPDAQRDPQLNSVPGQSVIDSRFIRLSEGEYEVDEYAGFITFKTAIQENEAIAVAYRIEGNTTSADDDIYYGDFFRDFAQDDTSRTLLLKLIKPENLQPPSQNASFGTAWKLKLKNIYPIDGRDVKEEGFVLDIKYQLPGQEPQDNFNGTKYTQLFNLDRTDAAKTGGPDGAFDFFPGRTILPATGEIVFPVLEPFGRDLPAVLGDSLRYDAIYTQTKTDARQDREKDKFVITGEYSASVSSTFNIGFNVVENSVRVLLNGNELREGSDYSVDYNIGQVTIRNDAALVPGADLRITYEKNDLFALASKTLLGLRGIYEFSKKTTLGFSFLNLNQQTLSDKVRIGEEPLNNSIYGIDFQTEIDLPFITKGLDNIISTNKMSTFSFKGEYAYIDPDPNTKKSTISSDQSKSIAYIDDFEGAKRIIPIGISYTGWKDLSFPEQHQLDSTRLTNLERMNYKGKSWWFNILPSPVQVKDIWPQRQAAREDEQVTVLDYVFEPTQRGAYNYDPQLNENTFQNWGGMMKPLSNTANNLTEERIEFIEFWLQVVEAPNDAKIRIDIGQISEDVIPNGRLDTEDKNLNDLVDEGEDTGIDGIFDAQERLEFASSEGDPSNDNFNYSPTSSIDRNQYIGINGTEGNAALTDIGRFPDSEDLNRNFTLDRVNSYYSYEIPIDTLQNKFVVGGGGENKGWFLYRIPLKDFVDEIGSPSFSVVETIRIWMTEVDQPVHVRFAELNLVGNQWQKVEVAGIPANEDSTITISTINIEDNPEYTSPPGVNRERDRSKPDQEVFKNEQSLLLTLKELEDGDKREVIKYLYRPLDLFNYRELKMFVHGDENDFPGSVSQYINEDFYAAEIYLRFGTDTLNYYEYRQPVRAGWNEISMVFSELTAIKQTRNNSREVERVMLPDFPGHSYAVLGDPTLTKVTFFSVGIINPTQKVNNVKLDQIPDPYGLTLPISGDIWINELRVINADDSKGWAYSGSTSINLADLLTVRANTSRTNPYFHKISERFGSRIDRTSWGVSFDLDVLKLMPFNTQGSNLTVNYSRNESIAKPIFLPGTDIDVSQASEQLRNKLISDGLTDEEAKEEANRLTTDTYTVNIKDTWTLSNIKFKIPTKLWYIEDTFNQLSFNFSYNKTIGRSPTVLRSLSWVWNAGANYSVNMSRDLFFYPANIPLLGDLLSIFEDYRNVKVFFTPQNFNSSFKATRKRNSSLSRNANAAENIQRDFTGQRSASFGWQMTEGGLINLSLNYSVDVQSSYADLLTNIDPVTQIETERTEGEIWRDIFGGNLFGKDYNYNQNFDLRTNPKMPSIWDLNRYFTITATYGVRYNWKNNFNQEELGKGASFSNRISAGLTLRLKSLFAPLFGEEESKSASTRGTGNTRGGTRTRTTTPQTTDADPEAQVVSDSTEVPTEPIYTRAFNLLKAVTKYIVFDYDQISFNYSQTNSKSGSGLAGEGTGFSNFWGISQKTNNGPSRAFMLGLDYDLGPRAPNGNLRDQFTKKNSFDIKTSRPLWEGATLDITWNVGWGNNSTTTIQTDSLGNAFVTNVTATGTIDRSFLTLPKFILFDVFNDAGITKVNSLYNPNSANPTENLSQAFVDGFESINWLSRIPILADVTKYIPRPNWRINWNGLEKIPLFSGIADRVSLSHAYNSSYSEGWKITTDGVQEIQTQRINYGFAPLVGLNLTFGKLWGGNLTGSVKYSTKTSYDLGVTTRKVTESFSKDINISASFSKSGFEIPLFGLSLKNDLEISFSYTSGQNSSVVFDMGPDFNEEGKPQDGTTRTTIEPRIKYVMSSRVTLSLFYKRTSVEPEGAARIPPTTTNEAGLDVNISIQ